jgi:PST family polysaccharide transporter
MADLKRKSVRGGMVTMLSQGISIAIQLTSTVVLARLLSPADYGIMAMVMAFTGFAGLFRDLGLSSAAIQKKDLTHAQQSNLFWINVAMGTILSAVVAAASPLIAWFYGKPELIPVTVALAAPFLINSLSTQHGARLTRDLRFGRQAAASIPAALVTLACSIILAFWGFGYWSLVWSSLAGSVVGTILLQVLSPFRPSPPHRGSGIRDMIKFGANVTAFDFVNYFHRNLDNILIGKFCGPGPLGFYSRAYSLLMLPINSLRGPINAVGFPALSSLQDAPEGFRNYYRNVAHLLALVSMPFTAFLFVAASPIVALALGPDWSGITPIFSILALVGFVQPVITLWGMVVLSRGLGRRYLHLGFFNTVASALGFSAGLPWGPVGVATGYAVVTYVTALPILHWAFRGTPLRLADFLAGTVRPCAASVVAAASCMATSQTWGQWQAPWQVLTSGLIMGGIYLLVIRLLPGGRSDFALIGNIVRPLSARLVNY